MRLLFVPSLWRVPKVPAKKSVFCSETEYEMKYGAGSDFSFNNVKLRSISCFKMSSKGVV